MFYCVCENAIFTYSLNQPVLGRDCIFKLASSLSPNSNVLCILVDLGEGVMPLAKRVKTRNNLRAEIRDALANESDPQKLRRLISRARKQISYNELVKSLQRKHLDLILPKAKLADTSVIDLRECWIEASIRLENHKLSKGTASSLKNKGYLQTMLGHIQPKGVGTGNFKKLVKKHALPLTSEYLIYNFFSHLLSSDVEMKAAKCLARNFCITPKHELQILASEGRLNEVDD